MQDLVKRAAAHRNKLAAEQPAAPSKSVDWGWGLGGAAAGLTGFGPAGLANKAYVSSAMGTAARRADPHGSHAIMGKMRDQGTKVTPWSYAPVPASWSDDVGRWAFVDKAVGPLKDNSIYYPDSHKHFAPAMAHEAGHATQPKIHLNRAGRLLGIAGSAGGSLGAMASSNEDTGRMYALGGTLANVPTLASEIDASVRGDNMLQKIRKATGANRPPAGAYNPEQLNWKRHLPRHGGSPYIGLPTYLMTAGAPMIAHYAKKLLGGYNSPTPKERGK